MIVHLHTLIQDKDVLERHTFKLGDFPVESFSVPKHWSHKVIWEEKEGGEGDKVMVWHTATFTEEERAYLIKKGKLGVFNLESDKIDHNPPNN